MISVETRLTNFRPNLSSVISIAIAAPLFNPGLVALELRRLRSKFANCALENHVANNPANGIPIIKKAPPNAAALRIMGICGALTAFKPVGRTQVRLKPLLPLPGFRQIYIEPTGVLHCKSAVCGLNGLRPTLRVGALQRLRWSVKSRKGKNSVLPWR
jgi:hypothetical protein